MPESISNCGELTVPALTMTSSEAVSRWITPAASRYSTPTATLSVKQNALDVCPGEDGQIRSPSGRPQVRVRGTVPQPAAVGHRRRCIPGVVRLVEFAETAHTQLRARRQECRCGRVRVTQLGDELRARRAVHRAGVAAHPVLGSVEIPQDLVVGPAGTIVRPAVVGSCPLILDT